MDPDPSKVGRNWGCDVQPYIKNTQIYNCPNSVPRSSWSAGSAYAETTDPAGSNASYLLNGITSSKAMAAIPAPADIIFLHEYRFKSRVSQVRPCLSNATTGAYNQFNHFFYDAMHNEGANLLYCDGHAKFKKKTAIMFKDFGANTTTLADPNRRFQDEATGCNSATCPDNGVALTPAF